MSTQAHASQPNVEVTLMTASEWRDTVRTALARLGLTYEQLAEQAERNDFDSLEARKLWVAIGGTHP